MLLRGEFSLVRFSSLFELSIGVDGCVAKHCWDCALSPYTFHHDFVFISLCDVEDAYLTRLDNSLILFCCRWDQGLLDMCIGEKRTLTIPPEYGYGDRGIGPIPGGATLVFETELVAIEGVEKDEL